MLPVARPTSLLKKALLYVWSEQVRPGQHGFYSANRRSRYFVKYFLLHCCSRHAPRIRRRIVAWGENAQPIELPHSGIVLSEPELLSDLWQRVALPTSVLSPAGAAELRGQLTLLRNPGCQRSPKALAPGRRPHSRSSSPSKPRKTVAGWNLCPDGWLFLLPYGEGHAMLISTGYSPDGLIEQSRLILRQIAALEDAAAPAHQFPAYSQILPELCGPLGSPVVRRR